MSVEFQDRVSTYPNRYKVTKPDGTSEYVTLERADEPTTVGTPLNAAVFNSAFASMRPNTWMPSLSDIGAAPAGYGLGAKSVFDGMKRVATDEEVQAIGESGLYYYNGPSLSDGCLAGIIRAEVGSNIYKTLWYTDFNGYHLRRELVNGTWGPWEWENPPMTINVEYRTTERWDGNAVYCKRLSIGALPNNSAKQVQHGLYGSLVIRQEAVTSNGITFVPLPIIEANAHAALYTVSADYIYINATTDYSQWTNTYVTLYYIK